MVHEPKLTRKPDVNGVDILRIKMDIFCKISGCWFSAIYHKDSFGLRSNFDLEFLTYNKCKNKITANFFSWWARVWIFTLVRLDDFPHTVCVLCTIIYKKNRHGTFWKHISGKFHTPPVHGVISRCFSFHHPELPMQLPVEFFKLLNKLQGRTQQHKAKYGKCQKNMQMVLVLTGMFGFFSEGCSGFSSWRVKLALETRFWWWMVKLWNWRSRIELQYVFSSVTSDISVLSWQ